MRGVICYCHKHVSLVPIESHHVWPLGYAGPNTLANRVNVCANGHSDAHYLIEAMLKRGRVKLPWSVRRHYGYKTRRLARRGYDAVIAHADDMASRS